MLTPYFVYRCRESELAKCPPPHPSLHLKRFTETNEAVIRRRYFSQFPLPLKAAGFVEIVFPVDSKAPAADSISYDANF